ncbi:acyl-CoA dehydrogenase family protein [Actinokineospora sp. NBRC 105648]|uniref:acyl-CoA dehydrogenase family protein n=1 Tax=Actinokineospora sp. NBRC 105648 TaxID=3032206 RepID=UPI0024A389F9|nr:acyl-CoA dehydrogenase family protein [Actinokineospora sp. NBRC 105648]GLZ39078.1 acyl-CoA dehydrogenase [Actinokineospora sp. NBRC 105648]
MSSVHLGPDHERFRRRVRALLESEVVPRLPEWERARHIPRSGWRLLGTAGLLGLATSTEHDLFHSLVLLEELGRTGYSGFRAAVAVHAYMATHYLPRTSPRLTTATRGESVGALAITEPGAGSDLAALTTRAHPDGDWLVLDGHKTMITNGTTADFLVVATRTGEAERGPTGLSLVVVDAPTTGLSATPIRLPGWHCADTADIHLTNVRVPRDNVLGKPNTGFYQLMRGLQTERVVAAALALGGIERCLADTQDFARARTVFGTPLATSQVVRHALASMATELAAARTLTYDAAWRLSRGDLPVAECSMAKLYATELACRVADKCLQLHGSHGYQADSPIARAHTESRAATMAAGPSEVMLDLIATELLT